MQLKEESSVSQVSGPQAVKPKETSSLEASLDHLSRQAPEDQINRRFDEMDALVKEFDEVREKKSSGDAVQAPEVKVSMGLPRVETAVSDVGPLQAQAGAGPEISVPMSPPPFAPEEIVDHPHVNPSSQVKRSDSKSVDLGIRRGAHDALIKPLRPAAVSFASAALDSVVILALSLIFLVSLLLVTEVDLGGVMSSLQREASVQISLLVLYLAIMTMYTVILRSFFGRTLGEWTFDFQMGTDEDIQKMAYPLRVVWRSVLNLITGVVLLPLISAMLNKDIAAPVTGLQLYRKND